MTLKLYVSGDRDWYIGELNKRWIKEANIFFEHYPANPNTETAIFVRAKGMDDLILGIVSCTNNDIDENNPEEMRFSSVSRKLGYMKTALDFGEQMSENGIEPIFEGNYNLDEFRNGTRKVSNFFIDTYRRLKKQNPNYPASRLP